MLAACSGGGGGGDDDNPPIDAEPQCVESWLCTPWQTSGASNTATRTCTDQNACGTTANQPVLSADLPALDPEYYECSVEPILVRNCSMLGCHGTETGRAYRIYARGRLRVTGQTIIEPGCLIPGTEFPSEECIGSIECKCWSVPQFDVYERRPSFDSARGFALGVDGQPLGDMTQSELLTQPLIGGPFAHAGISMWNASASDSDYTTIKNWLEGATRPTACNSQN